MRAGGWFCIGLAACGPAGKLTGRVEIILGDPSQATVTVTGPATASAGVSADGTYELEDLPNGVYRVEAIAPSTLEGRVEGNAQVLAGSGTAQELRLTAAGQVSGFVTSAGPVSGAQVSVVGGTQNQAVGPQGAFAITLAAGTQTLLATLSGFAPAQQQVEVQYEHETSGVTLSLSAAGAGPGAITGHAYYFDRQVFSGIQVAALGTGLSTLTASDGSFTLSGLPQGQVTLTYSATGYATATVDNVPAGVGAPYLTSDVRLYLAVNVFRGTVYGDTLYSAPDGSGALFVGMPVSDPATPWLYYAAMSGAAPAVPLRRMVAASPLAVNWGDAGAYALAAPTDGGTGQLWAVNTDAGTAIELTDALVDPASGFALAGSTAFFVQATNDGASQASAFDFSTGVMTPLGPISFPTGSAACSGTSWSPGTWPDAAQWLRVSPDGRAAYFSELPGGDAGTVQLYAQGAVLPVSGPMTCFGFHAGKLVGAQVGSLISLQTLAGAQSQRVVSAPAKGFTGGFSSDGTLAWMVSDDSGPFALTLASLSGAPPVVPYFTVDPMTVLPQPGGSDLAVYDGQGNQSVLLVSDGGQRLTSLYPSQPGLETGGVFFSPGGKWVVVGYQPDGSLFLIDVTTLGSIRLAGAPLTVSASSLASAFLFSADESVIAYAASFSGSCENELWSTSAPLASGSQSCPVIASWVEIDPSSRWALIRNAPDLWMDLRTRISNSLGASVYPLDGAPAFFTGDGSRLGYREAPQRPTRVFAIEPSTGQSRYLADDDGALFLSSPGRAGWWVLQDASLTPTGVSPGQPPGLYVLSP